MLSQSTDRYAGRSHGGLATACPGLNPVPVDVVRGCGELNPRPVLARKLRLP